MCFHKGMFWKVPEGHVIGGIYRAIKLSVMYQLKLKLMAKKVKVNQLSLQCSVILHYRKQGYRSTADIARLSKIPLCTVYYNIEKIKEQGTVEHRRGNGRHQKIKPEDSIAIRQ